MGKLASILAEEGIHTSGQRAAGIQYQRGQWEAQLVQHPDLKRAVSDYKAALKQAEKLDAEPEAEGHSALEDLGQTISYDIRYLKVIIEELGQLEKAAIARAGWVSSQF